MLKAFEQAISDHQLFQKKDKLLLAVSGGVDSVVLCELCHQSGYDFIIAHCNFQLRGEESGRDEQFVLELGKKYAVEVLVKKFDTEKYATTKKISIQEAARELRYGWFAELVTSREVGKSESPKNHPNNGGILPDFRTSRLSDSGLPTPVFLLTAHHADDNVETLLMNFSRGTGLPGLTGIPRSAGYIKRPLLNFSKQELLQFAKENKIDFVEDSSNQSSKYTRNLFRNEIIPAIEKVYPQVKNNLRDNIDRFIEIENLYKFSVGEIKKKICHRKGSEVHIPIKQLMGYDNRALLYEIISDYNFSEKQVDELIKLANSESGRYIQSPDNSHRIIRHRHWFIISPIISTEAANIIIEEKDKQINFPAGTFKIEMLDVEQSNLPTSNQVACLDAATIQFPLLLRKWKTGDYFYPLGMKKKKKLSRFFIDQKLSKTAKENAWVLEMNKKIIWVVGHRIDDRFKISSSTKTMIQIHFAPIER